jgi:hypothetical protein
MTIFSDLASVSSNHPAPSTDQLRLAVTAYLARFKGSSREHTESDLRCYLAWCAEHSLTLPVLNRLGFTQAITSATTPEQRQFIPLARHRCRSSTGCISLRM